jgi:hypothetical protein
MPRKSKTDTTEIPKFSLEKAQGQSKPLCKLVIRKIAVDDLSEHINKLLAAAAEAGHSPAQIRGTLYLY